MSIDERIHNVLDRWDADSGERGLLALCDGDADLFERSKSVAFRLKRADEFLNASANPSTPAIPGYELEQLIGAGGMGDVWRARQLSTRRTVALKILSTSISRSPRARARFEREVELASKLQHRNIARVYDSGIHQGSFFYAMELIDGIPLDDFVSRAVMTVSGILQLVATICDAMQHAHQMGIIHRDLKPGNILVTADRQPHIVDFGLARDVLLEGPSQLSLDSTVPGTPAYMSPEQAAGDVKRIGVGTDVYSMGVIAYQLLLGRLPHDVSGSPIEIVNRIATTDAAPPRQIDRAIDRDIEAILLKALSRDPAQRYATGDHFASDIRRWLRGLPIEARRRTTSYVVRKFLLRHRGRVFAAVCAIALAAAGTIVAFGTIKMERDRATAAADTAREINDFFTNMLATGNPELGNGITPTIQEVIDSTADTIDVRFKNRPLVEAGIRLSIGRTYIGLSQAERAAPHLIRALELRRKLLGETDPATLDARLAVVSQEISASNFAVAESQARAASKTSEAALGRLHEVTLLSLDLLFEALLYQGRASESQVVGTELERRYSDAYGKDDPRVAAIRVRFDAFLPSVDDDHIHRAETVLRSQIDRYVRDEGVHSPRALGAMMQLAANLFQQHRLDEADALLSDCLERRRQVFGNEHRYTAFCLHGLAFIKDRRGLIAEAESMYRESLSINLKLLGEMHIETLNDRTALFLLLHRQGRDAEVQQIIEEMDTCARRKLSEATAPDVTWILGYSDSLLAMGDKARAVRLLESLLSLARAAYGADDPRTQRVTAALTQASMPPQPAIMQPAE